MTRLTITLSPERHLALREEAARRGEPMARLIDEALDVYGIKTRQSAQELVARARAAATMAQDDALELAVQESRAVRRSR